MITVLTHDGQTAQVDGWLSDHAGRLALDTETTSLDVFDAQFECGAVVLGHRSGDALVIEGRARALVVHALKAVFSRGSTVWAHNAKYDAWVVRRQYGVALSSLRCSMVAAQTAWPGRAGGYSLKNLRPSTAEAQDALRRVWAEKAREHGCVPPVPGGSAHWLPDAVRHLRVGDCPELAAYAAEDAIETVRMIDELEQSRFAAAILYQVQVDQEWRWTGYDGIRLDTERLEGSIREIERYLAAAAPKFGGVEVWKNTAERREWLQAYGIVPAVNESTGRPSLDKDHRREAKVPQAVRGMWEEACRAMDMYASSGKLTELKRFVDEAGRLHPTIGVMTPDATTGRMSIQKPALQNLSKNAVPGVGTLRELLLADEGKVLVGCDLSYVEPSILAALSRDPVLVGALQKGADPYIDTAEIVWGAGRAEEMRGKAKVLLLALMYGMGVTSLARRLGVEKEEASHFRDRILGAWPGVAAWIAGVRSKAERGELQLTLGGRPIPDVRSKPYTAANYLIQGSAADIFKQMASRVRSELPAGARLWLPVHDELVIECWRADADKVSELLGRGMSTVVNGVPISGEPEVLGPRWRKT